MIEIEIFKPGNHTAMGGQTLSFSEADLAKSAEAYRPELHEAPLCVGHPAHDLPAYGWVKGLEVSGGALMARPDQVDPAFAELVKTGRYKKVSAAFYRPDAKGNPRPGVYYLRHVAFLGAQPPAVKGLKPVAFGASEDGCVTFGDIHDDREAELRRRELAIADAENQALLDSLIKDARFPGGLRDQMAAFLETLDDRSVISFSEAGVDKDAGRLEWFKGFLQSLPRMVEFGEVAKAGELPHDDPFEAPAGYQVDAAGLDMLKRAERYQTDHNVSFAEAARAVSRMRQ